MACGVCFGLAAYRAGYQGPVACLPPGVPQQLPGLCCSRAFASPEKRLVKLVEGEHFRGDAVNPSGDGSCALTAGV